MCDVHFMTEAIYGMCARHNCRPQAAPPRTHAPNRCLEIRHKNWARGVRALLKDQDRDIEDWADASDCYEQIKNCLYTSAAPEQPPYEGVFQKKPDFRHFQVPLSDCWYFVYPEEQNGPSPDRREKTMYVGIDMETDSYRLYNRDRRIYYSRRYGDVVFERPDNVYEYDPADDANLGVPRIDGIRDGVLIDEDVEKSDDDYSSSDSDSAPNLNSENDSSSPGDSSSSDSEEDDNEDNTASVWVSGDMSNWTAVKFASRYNISF